MKIKHTLWTTAIHPEQVGGEEYIPTAVHYGINGTTIGSEAMSHDDSELVNRNFKINLGDHVPGTASDNAKIEICADNVDRSAFEVTKDYFELLLKDIERKLPSIEGADHRVPARIIVAEPLGFQVQDESNNWLSYYRDNIRRILNRYDTVEFLPEPFAVYQYYRYGLRLPNLADRRKHIALILDYGGGTFDVCVIESTHEGDISLTGKHSKPLAASSIPCGGFYLNRRLALYLIKRDLDNKNKKIVDQEFKKYERVCKGEKGLIVEKLNPRTQAFIKNFQKLEWMCEKYKLEISDRISNWGLEEEGYDRIEIEVPRDPFSMDKFIITELFSHQFRKVFIDDIWKNKLHSVIKSVLVRSEENLNGKQIGVTLISGGSANIGWLKQLLVREFSQELIDAIPVNVNHSFQEIVANGLAIECARRFYNNDNEAESEFVAVTYNPIKLFLGTEETQLRTDLRFNAEQDKIDMKLGKPGDLIPVAQTLRHFFDQPLRWNVKLKHSPKNGLHYHFPDLNRLNEVNISNFAVKDYRASAYNVEQNKVIPVDKKSFDSSTIVEIIVSKDGTVRPKFIFKSANPDHGVKENSKYAKPFYINMTTDSKVVKNMSNFIGFDFGTSNSSICHLNENDINITHERDSDDEWKGIGEASHNLPFPISAAIREYLDPQYQSRTAELARTLVESCFAFLAYTLVSEATNNSDIINQLKHFPHRSLGPLKELLFGACSKLKWHSELFGDLDKLKESEEEINVTVQVMTDIKHDKLDINSVNLNSFVVRIVKLTAELLKDTYFGFCFSCEKKALVNEHHGTFLVAHDLMPFRVKIPYTSDSSMDRQTAMVINRVTGMTQSITPFYLFWEDSEIKTGRSCILLDSFNKDVGDPILKPCDTNDLIKASELDHVVIDLLHNLQNKGEIHTVEGNITFLPEYMSQDFN